MVRRAIALSALLLSSACGFTASIGAEGIDVGAACESDISCDETCISGSNFFPGGMCTWRCSQDSDCPGSTVCTDIKLTDSGSSGYRICAIRCSSDAQCFRTLKCSPVRKVGGTGEESICWIAGPI